MLQRLPSPLDRKTPVPAQRVTIYQVAERAGVSISTVSNALNKPDRVSDSTRQKVLSAADELGFVPSAEAVGHARRGSGRIGVMAPFTSYSSYLRRLSGVLGAAAAADVDVVVFDHESAAQSTSPVLASLPVHGRLDGLIVMGLEIESSIADRLHRRGLPTVVVDAASDLFCRVGVDDVDSGRLPGAHLVGGGHRRFGYLMEEQLAPYESQAVKRLAGFREAVTSFLEQELVVMSCRNSIPAARSAAREMLSSPQRPTAIMAHHDQLAIGVLLACRDLGLSVPGEVAVVGCDDGEAAIAADLTTVHQPFEESGQVAFAVLRAQREGSLRSTVELELRLSQRSTT
ncbi:LacI family transcriptional regulator [Humibacillus sp. DSM 29435]|uniref:LacI family DNA-binding transcriptional regulator n=1 Tax=Humibacillus sp. DSM 29435 TaxID=1869167 RepID=UPI000872DB00|nr:LacI family DNA-binding transcriptional regulator [Humibacillus sp. DSM 29435]OFE18347.1 LacI family transcriptional regulator [Humibacillus sp. DSM 29435]